MKYQWMKYRINNGYWQYVEVALGQDNGVNTIAEYAAKLRDQIVLTALEPVHFEYRTIKAPPKFILGDIIEQNNRKILDLQFSTKRYVALHEQLKS